MLKKPTTNSRMDAKTISPKPRPSACRPPAPPSGLLVADVIVTSRVRVAGNPPPALGPLPLASDGRRHKHTAHGPVTWPSPSPSGECSFTAGGPDVRGRSAGASPGTRG